MSKVAVVILNWNNASDTIACITSVKALQGVDFFIVCVDNASIDDSVSKISSSHPDVTIHLSPKNLGYAGGNNFGIEKALQAGASHIWILNNDTEIDPLCLKNLLAPFLTNPTIGITGSKIYYYADKEKIWFAGGIYYPFRGVTTHYLENSKLSGVLSDKKLDYVSGCSMLLSAAAIHSIKGFDASLFLLYEEIDICNRAKKNGYSVKMCETSLVYHKVSQTLPDSPLRLYYFTRNRLYISLKHYPLFLPFVLLWCVRWPLLPALIKRPQNIKYVLKAFSDFFTGKMGAYAD
ncbi:MAG: glycosyltransferase family 2 protein [bacterium]